MQEENAPLWNTFRQTGALWLAAREEACDLTASQMRALLGLSSNCSRHKLWEEMYGETREPEEKGPYVKKMLAWGRYCEPHIRAGLKELGAIPQHVSEWGLFTRRFGELTIGASPDGMTKDRQLLLEIKASCPLRDGTFKEAVTTVPMGDLPQCITQMAVTGSEKLIYARHNGLDQCSVFELEWSPSVWKHILREAKRFVGMKNSCPKSISSGEKRETQAILQQYITEMTHPVGTFTMRMPKGFYDF